MAEPMGKLKSKLLLFALAFGVEGRCPPPPAAAVQVGGCGDESLSCPGVPSVFEVRGLRRVQTLFLRRQKYTQILSGHLENSLHVVCSAEGAQEQTAFGTNRDKIK